MYSETDSEKSNKLERKYEKSRSSSFKKKSHPKNLSSELNEEYFIPDKYIFESPYASCSCCHEYNGKEILYECCVCYRKYHDYCHIPIIVSRSEKTNKIWRCTMCEDMNTISMVLGEDGDQENISVGTVGRKVAERILMELYCNTDGSDIFNVRPNPMVNLMYYESIGREIALNDVRDLLIINKNYKLSEVVEDLKLVLVNAISYYDVSDPYFNAARKLLNHLHRMYQSWIALPTKKKHSLRVNSE